ncbi:MAG: DUF3826 domain-containing protein [Prevotella sp.]|nr:DUF3826 domain-containing protein [Prevotella sp.]
MKKVLSAAVLWLLSLTAGAQTVALNTEGQDTAYVENIVSRSQKIVDGLGLTDAQKAENVRNIIANRYFLLNNIHSECDKRKQYAKDSISGAGRRQRIIEGAERRRDAELYKHHFELVSALALYLTDEQIDAVKDGMTYGRLKRDYNAQLEMIPTLTEEEKAQVLAWLKEAREYAMDGGDSKQKHFWFDKYRGRTNNWLSSRGYDLKKERENWQKRIEEAKKK